MQSIYLLIFFGWGVQITFQLACIQCTSSIERISQETNQPCLDATILPISCSENVNKTDEEYQNCISAVYTLVWNGYRGLYIHRGCSVAEKVRHECDPPEVQVDLDEAPDFFCSQTCSTDGCNQHTVEEITSKSSSSSHVNRTFHILFFFIFIILLQ